MSGVNHFFRRGRRPGILIVAGHTRQRDGGRTRFFWSRSDRIRRQAEVVPHG